MVAIGESNLRGIEIDKVVRGFADEEFIFKRFLTVLPTSAREIRYFTKTTGALDSTDTTGVTASQIPTSPLSKPVKAGPSYTRNTTYIRHYKVESDLISAEDLKDNDVSIELTILRDLTRAVLNQVDTRIFAVLNDTTNANTSSAAGSGWDDTSNGNPIMDLLSGAMAIRDDGYDVTNLVALVNPTEYKNLMNYLITVKGSSIPAFSSDLARGDGVLTNVAGTRIVVSNNATAGTVIQFVPQRAAQWRSFMEITGVRIDDPLIGTIFRVAEEGEAILTDPKAVTVIQNAG